MVTKATESRKKRPLSEYIMVTGIFTLLFILPMAFLIYHNVKMNQKRGELIEQARELQTEIEELQQRRMQLEATIESADSVEFQEKVLREQGLFQKPGEEVITIVPVIEEGLEEEEESQKIWWNPFSW